MAVCKNLDSVWIWFYKERAPNQLMERRPLKIASRPLNFLSVKLLVFWVILGVVWITTAGRIPVWITFLLPFAGLVTIAVWQTRFGARHLIWTMLTAHCPQCGTFPMNYKTSSKDHGFLICEKCQIEWDLGRSTGAFDKTYDNSETFAKSYSDIIDKQIQNNDPPETRQTMERLKSEGHSADDARQLISAAVAVEIFHIYCERKPSIGERYAWNLKRLPQMPWDAQGKEIYRA